MASKVLFRAVVLLAAFGSIATAGERVPEYQLKAELLERFTRFVEWPGVGEGNGSPFVIGVIGRNPFGQYLDAIGTSRRIKGRAVEIREISELAQIDGCHVLFVAASEKQQLHAILARTESRPILTVADSDGFAVAGVMLNFYQSGDTVRFEMNEAAVERSGLKVSSKLFKIARLVDPEER